MQLAQSTINLNRPSLGTQAVGFSNVGSFINNAITLAFVVAMIIVFVMLVWGAIEWMLSGGDKDAVGKARGKIIHALVGLAILAVAYAILTLVASFLGVSLTNLVIPSPS